MAEIKTNYKQDSKWVLVDESDKVIAIINIPNGADITEKVKLAIKEELNATDVVFEGDEDFEIGEFDYQKHIDFIYSDEDEEEYSRYFTLVRTEEY
jgi:hypothetical protein